MMKRDLKSLVVELERILTERGSKLDAHALEVFETKISDLHKAIDKANALEMAQLRIELFRLTAELLVVVTNVMTFFR